MIFYSQRGTVGDLFMKAATGAGADEPLLISKFDKYPNDWSRDGRTRLFEVTNQNRKQELWTLSLADRKASPYLQTNFNTGHAAPSPNGHWIANASDESGRLEVYVQSFPVPVGGRYTISSSGGDEPIWRRDGKELFYATLDQKLMAVPVTHGSDLPGATAALAVPGSHGSGLLFIHSWRNFYVPSADGKKFLIFTITDATSSSPMTVVLNWTAGIGK